MVRNHFVSTLALTSVPIIAWLPDHAVERGRQSGGRESERGQSGERQSPGGSWSERSHQAGSTHHQHQYTQGAQGSIGKSGGREGFSGRTPQNSRDENGAAF